MSEKKYLVQNELALQIYENIAFYILYWFANLILSNLKFDSASDAAQRLTI